MSEAAAYRTFRRNVPMLGDRLDRVENRTGNGTPDINMCIEGTELWIEQKSPTEPRRSKTPLFGSNHRVSPAQRNWFLRQHRAGGRAYFLVTTDRRWMLLPGALADCLNAMTVAEMLDQSVWSTTKPIRDRTQWSHLRQALRR